MVFIVVDTDSMCHKSWCQRRSPSSLLSRRVKDLSEFDVYQFFFFLRGVQVRGAGGTQGGWGREDLLKDQGGYSSLV